MKVRGSAALLFALVFLARSAPAVGETTGNAGRWEVRVVPYLWLTGMQADLRNPETGGSDVLSFGNMWTIEAYGGSVYLEAQKGRLAFIGDGIYIQEEIEGTPSNPHTAADVTQLSGELSLAYRPSFLGPVEVVVGALATSLQVDVAVADSLDTVVDNSWVDPILGLRVRSEAGKRVTLLFRGDVSGFGVNDALGVRLLVEGNLYLSDRLYFLTAYRFGYLDYNSDTLEAEVMFNGLALGLGYLF